MKYQCSKTYGHNEGLSACFRQWRADSHCHFLHGYALSIKLVFECDDLDARNWCQDFGSLKPVKEWLKETFDHKCIVADDDPKKAVFELLNAGGLIQMKTMKNVGCEAFAWEVGLYVISKSGCLRDGVRLVSVEVREHEGNSATAFF